MSKIIVYDFDGTLTKASIPKYPILDGMHLKLEIKTMLNYLLNYEKNLYNSYYETYFKMLSDMGLALTNENFCYGAEDIPFRNGVLEYFERSKKEDIKHFIVTSGYASFVEKTKIGEYIEKVYGTTYKFKDDVATGVDILMDNKNKVLALEEICDSYKGELTYLGDGLTDIHAFNYVKKRGGKCVLLKRNGRISLPNEALLLSGVIDHYVDANFSKNSELCKNI